MSTRPETLDRQRKAAPQTRREVNLARISTESAGTGEGRSTCSCGWSFFHKRPKVREDAVDRHLAKRHDSRGVRF